MSDASDTNTKPQRPKTVDGRDEKQMEYAITHFLDDLASGAIKVELPDSGRPLARGNYST